MKYVGYAVQCFGFSEEVQVEFEAKSDVEAEQYFMDLCDNQKPMQALYKGIKKID